MVNLPYISDNPFRLLSVGSETLLPDLRRLARLASKSAMVGLATEVSLSDELGTEDLVRCDNMVRSLAMDPVCRTLYRLFWVRRSEHAGALRSIDSIVTFQEATEVETLQNRFLYYWTCFCLNPNACDLEYALQAFSDLYDMEELDNWLCDLLIKEGEASDDALEHVYRAQDRLISHMLEIGCSRGIDMLERGDEQTGIEIIKGVVASPYDEDWVHKGLLPVVPIGNREMTLVREAIRMGPGWRPGDDPYNEQDVRRLRLLADTVLDHLPVALEWKETCIRRVEQVAVEIRNHAIDLAKDRKYRQAAALLDHTLQLALPDDLRAQIRQDLRDLHHLSTACAALDGMTQVECVPSLYTINGVGTRLYGRSPVPGLSGRYYTTLYFVVFFLPVLPLKRYVVSDAPGGGWYFHAVARFGDRNVVHVVALLTVLILIALGNVLDSSKAQFQPVTASQQRVFPPVVSQASPQADVSATPQLPKYEPGNRDSSDNTSNTSSGALISAPADSGPSPELLNLRSERTRLIAEVEKSKRRLDIEQSALMADIEHIRSERIYVDTTDEYAVARFNSRVNAVNSRRNVYNRKVREHNSKVNRLTRIEARLRELGD